MNDFNRHKKSDKIKWILTGAAFVLIFVFLVGLCMQLFAKDDKYKPSEWFKKPETEQTQPDENEKPEAAAVSFIAPRLTAKTMSATADSDNGVSAQRIDYVETYSNSNSSNSNLTLGYYVKTKENDKFEYTVVFGAFQNLGSNRSSMVLQNSAYPDTVFTIGVLVGRNYFAMSGSGMNIPSVELFSFAPYTVMKFTDTEVTFAGCDIRHPDAANLSISKTYSSVSPEYASLKNFFITGVSSSSIPSVNSSSCENVSSIICDEHLKLYEAVEVTPIPLPDEPVKEGYTFVGWYYDSELTQPYDGEPIYEDTALYAKFEINKFTVTFNSDGGSSVENKTVNWNTKVTLTTPTRAGYIFKGWFLSDGTEYTNQPITSDITLTAQWEIIMCTVTFYVGDEIYETKQVEYGTSLIKVVESANELNLCVMSVRSANGVIGDVEFANMTVTDDSVEVVAEELTGTDKVINTVKNNKWQIIGGVAGGVALIAVIAALCSGIKRKKR